MNVKLATTQRVNDIHGEILCCRCCCLTSNVNAEATTCHLCRMKVRRWRRFFYLFYLSSHFSKSCYYFPIIISLVYCMLLGKKKLLFENERHITTLSLARVMRLKEQEGTIFYLLLLISLFSAIIMMTSLEIRSRTWWIMKLKKNPRYKSTQQNFQWSVMQLTFLLSLVC